MSDLNRATLLGRLTRDPELKYTPGGDAVCTFSVATNYSYGGRDGEERKEGCDFHDVVVWRGLAENVAKYLAKGRQVYIEGPLKTRTWEAEDGSPRRRTEVQAKTVIFLGQNGEGGQSARAAFTPPDSAYGTGQDVDPDEIPF